jgi:hypothetical protein
MAHGGKDLPAEPFIAREAGHGERLDEVPLGESLHLQVVRLPSGQLGEFGGCGEELPSHAVGAPAVSQQRCDVGAKVLNDGRADTPAAEPVVKYPERACRLADLPDVGHPDTASAFADVIAVRGAMIQRSAAEE